MLGISYGALFPGLLHSVHDCRYNQARGDQEKQTDADYHPFESVWIGI